MVDSDGDVRRIRHLADPCFARSDVSTHIVIGKSAHSSNAEVDTELRGGTPKDTCSRSFQGVANKRARTRLRSHCSSHPQKPTWFALIHSASSRYKSDVGVGVSSDRSTTNYNLHPCESTIAGVPLEFSVEEQAFACRRYAISHLFRKGRLILHWASHRLFCWNPGMSRLQSRPSDESWTGNLLIGSLSTLGQEGYQRGG